MKPIKNTLLILALGGLMGFQASALEQCRDLPAGMDTAAEVTQLIEADLVRGVWKVHAAGDVQQMLRFDADGTARRHTSDPPSQAYATEDLQWQVDLVQHEPVLSLRGSESPQRFYVDPTCEGLLLTDLDRGTVTTFEYVEPDQATQKARLRQLAGQWVNTHPNLKLEAPCEEARALRIKRAEVRYTFHPNGTFDKVLSSRSDPALRYAENGRWEVTEDGQHLILYRQTANGETLTTCANIKYLELDEMVLSHPVASIGSRQLANSSTDLFFNKH